jgi:hypothetical protein
MTLLLLFFWVPFLSSLEKYVCVQNSIKFLRQ